MAKVEFKLENLRLHGFPYACLLCGSDEDPTPRPTKFKTRGVGAIGCLLFFGPIAWFIIGINLLISAGKAKKIDVPICDCCHEAKRQLFKRDVIIAVAGFGLSWWTVSTTLVAPYLIGTGVLLGLALMLAAGFEYAWLSKQFTWICLKSDHDRIVLELPNEDYPSVYQRHLDTALLYGAVENAGASEEDPDA